MIRKVEITKTYIEDQEEFLIEFQKAISEALRAPLGIILDTDKPEQVIRAEIIIRVIKEHFPKAVHTLVMPGTLIQILLPQKELLISIQFLINKQTNEKRINLELCKLTSEDIIDDD